MPPWLLPWNCNVNQSKSNYVFNTSSILYHILNRGSLLYTTPHQDRVPMGYQLFFLNMWDQGVMDFLAVTEVGKFPRQEGERGRMLCAFLLRFIC
jgi:hypothetical protein